MVGTDSTSKSMKKIVCLTFLFDRQLLFNLLVYDYRTHSSNISPSHRSESNPHSPADLGDQVIRVNGKNLSELKQSQLEVEALLDTVEGDVTEIVILKDGKEKKVEIKRM